MVIGRLVATIDQANSHLLGISGYLTRSISSKRLVSGLVLLGFEEVVPDLLLLVPV